MKLSQIRLLGLGPFRDETFRFVDDSGAPLPSVTIFGGSGVGKTTILSAIAMTRPGNTVVIQTAPGLPSQGFAVADWSLGDDDPARPHALQLASPNAAVRDEGSLQALRREQSHFDKQASQGGFSVVTLPASRWFSVGAVNLMAPTRTVLRHDVRAGGAFDDATRSDLSRETKQALVFASLAGRLPEPGTMRPMPSLAVFEEALLDVVNRLVGLVHWRWAGLDPSTLEPVFAQHGGPLQPFDRLPTAVRHLVGIAVLAVRGLFAAYPGRDPRLTEGVVLVDEVGLHQDRATQRRLVPVLRAALPRVQWIVTTSSIDVTLPCEPSTVWGVRKGPLAIEVSAGTSAIFH